MAITTPVLSPAGEGRRLNLGGSSALHRVASEATGGAISAVEFLSEPGEGVGMHVHEREDEFVYLLDGEIDVTVGGQTVRVRAGACAVLPRGIPHGYVNTGSRPSRLLAVLVPGGLDAFFTALDEELSRDRPHEAAVADLCASHGLRFEPNDTAR